ncbi:MAG: glycogen debranching protein GlgX [bacterium]
MVERTKKRTKRSPQSELTTGRGRPLPLGATVSSEGINYSLFSKHATEMTLILYKAGKEEPFQELKFDPLLNRTGDIWHIFIYGVSSDIEYGFRASLIPNQRPDIYRFDPSKLLIDPYAKSLSGGESWRRALPPISTINTPWRRSRVIDQGFDWEADQPLKYHPADSIIYELHVRGFTRHPKSSVNHQGTFKGLSEKIPYLKELGVTTVELMPVTDFLETDCRRYDPVTGDRLVNYWGYHPISYFALKASYASQSEQGGEVREFKEMVKAMHAAGIEVILDVVYNHTGESDETYETLSFRGLDNPIYYIVDPSSGKLENYSGCGNTINCNHTVVREHIIDSLRYWVTEMHVDGFRFDLASILTRGIDGKILAAPPLLEQITNDPVLAHCKLIAEPWDAAGAYHVGSYPHWGRWAEWNGRYRDDIRRFWRGDEGKIRSLATRICGSADLYMDQKRAPYHSINFITSHDGFTLADLVSYQEKHNGANGEGNRDGENLNFSCNWGVEGPADDPAIHRLRKRMIKNYLGTLLLSHGVPMLMAGDEFGRTQQGNNNAYCQDNEISWIDWSLLQKNADLFRFVKGLIAFRKRYSFFRPHSYFKEDETYPAILWHGVSLHHPDWNDNSHALAMEVRDKEAGSNFFMIMNAFWEELKFAVPANESGKGWSRVIDTSLPSPDDIVEEEKLVLLDDQSYYRVSARSLVLLIR